MVQARDIFQSEDADEQARSVRSWLEVKGVLGFSLLPVMAEELDKVTLL
jgi:hypothetical protein